jgi:hypothetical protein
MMDIDYRIYYDLEQYLFRDVNSHFRDNRKLDAFDFFCIVIWKANRAKSRVASLLLKKFVHCLPGWLAIAGNSEFG